MTILRSAIVYINSLKQLISDCDANLIDTNLYSPSSLPPPSPPLQVQSPGIKPQKVQNSGGQNKVKNSKRVILESKWTNYSQQFLQDKFSKDSPDKSEFSCLPPITAVQPSTDALLTQLASNPIRTGLPLKEPQLKVQNLPNIDELFGGQMMDTGSAGANIQICIQLIEDPSRQLDMDIEEYTDIAAQCLSL